MARPTVVLQPEPGDDVTAAVVTLLERERLLGATAKLDSAWHAAALAEGVERGDVDASPQAVVPRNSRGAARA